MCGVSLFAPAIVRAELSDESLIGPGLRSRPAYDGSKAQRWELVPVVRSLGQPVFIRSTQGVMEGGIRVALSPGLHLGAQLAYEPGRQASESGFLQSRHVADIRAGASAGVQLELDHRFGPMPVTLLLHTRHRIDGAHGSQADLRLSAGAFQRGAFSAGLFVQSIWADSKSNARFYGLTPESSAVTGLPVYQPGAGWLSSSFGLLWSVDLAPRWKLLGNFEARQLRSGAAHSPLVERPSNHFVSAGLACLN
jgi:outer membrane scaffolding protein for murein synthesis (MipA/OmpV family)